MAKLIANHMHPLPSEGSVTITLDPGIKYAQLVSEGFSLEDASIQVTPIGTTAKHTVVAQAGTGITGSIGDGLFGMTDVTISGVTGADLKVGAYQG